VLFFFIMLSPALATDGPTLMDHVTLMDGNILYSEVVEVAGGMPQIKTATSPWYKPSPI
jgi:hypothetical protein